MTFPVHSALTPRESEVLRRLLQGQTIRTIAEGCGIGQQTVKNYVTVIYEKVGVRDRAQLLRCCAVPAAVDRATSRSRLEHD